MNESFEHTEGDWFFRIQKPAVVSPSAVLIAIHGWTGNETSMGIFTRNLSQTRWVIFPRAPFPSPNGGYSWAEGARGVKVEYATFQAIGQGLLERLKKIMTAFNLEGLPVQLVGFSQGAALSLAVSLDMGLPSSGGLPSGGLSFEKVGLLAGFLPVNSPAQDFSRLPEYLIAHGTQDEIVPVEHAREVLAYLESKNARVDYCETDTGHKLGAACFRTLENFFQQRS